MHRAIFIMGVSGSGKTTAGKLLGHKTGFPFFDADDFHPQKNKEKMAAGIPLTDEDRLPWLQELNQFLKNAIQNNSCILACSALKENYRALLSNEIQNNCCWFFLKGDASLITERIKKRKDHFMPVALLQSQFDALEIPAYAFIIDITQSPESIASEIHAAIL